MRAIWRVLKQMLVEWVGSILSWISSRASTQRSMLLWYIAIGALLSLVTVAGNGLVIFVIAKRSQLRNPTNWIILSLAAADALIGLVCISLEYISETFSITHRLRFAIPSFLFAASATNLCLLIYDRFVFITRPLRYVALMTTRKTSTLILTVWVISFLPHFVFFLLNDILHLVSDLNAERNFMLFDFAFFEILPMVLLSCTTVRIFHIARKRARETSVQIKQLSFNRREARGPEDTSTNTRRTTSIRVIGVAVGVFLVCYINDVCYTILYQLRDGKNKTNAYRYILNLLYIANSAINPVSYALFKRDIREAMKSMFHFNRWTQIPNISVTICQLSCPLNQTSTSWTVCCT